jgi:sugar lactone lactonase YvrE
MHYQNGISRRHVLAMSAAVSSLAIGSVLRRASAQATKRIERLDPSLDKNGMKVDTAGNVYSGGTGGIWILDSQGKKLGRIVHGYPATTNIAFGGDDWKTLFFTGRNTLGAVNVKIPGLPVPAAKKS